jgi:RNA polymerase sigma factor (sigma-70 family)
VSNDDAAELCRRWQEHRDERALSQLICSVKRMANQIAERFAKDRATHFQQIRGWCEYEDVRQWATIGVVKAASAYDVSRGNKFSTMAHEYARREVQHWYEYTRGKKRVANVCSMDSSLPDWQNSRNPCDYGVNSFPGYHNLIPSSNPNPYQAYCKTEMRERIDRCLDAMPRGQALAVRGYYLAGLSDRECAELAGVTPQANQLRRRKALAKLRAELCN